MKTFKQLRLLILIAAAITISLQSCKPGQVSSSNAYGQELEETPCAKSSDTNYRRAYASGESPDREYSVDLARQAARDRLAQDIKTRVVNVMQKYREQASVDGAVQGFAQVNQDGSLQVVNEVLENLTVYCSRTFQKNTGIYTSFVGYEMSKSELKNGLDKFMQGESNKSGTAYRKDQFFNHFDAEFSQP